MLNKQINISNIKKKKKKKQEKFLFDVQLLIIGYILGFIKYV